MRPTDGKSLRVSLPRALFEGLEEQAQRLGLPLATLARAAIEEWVCEAKRAQVEGELRRYVAAMAGTESDLDEAFEQAGTEAWRRLA